MKLNLNKKVEVILTKRGAQIINNEVIYGTFKEGDVFRTELWNLMVIFGEYLFNGCKIPFENNEIRVVE